MRFPRPAGEMRRQLAFVGLLVGAVAIGCSPIFVRLSELGPIATAVYRVALAVPVFVLAERLVPKPPPRRGVPPPPPTSAREHMLLVLAGLFFAGDLAFWHWSIKLTSVANATFFANMAPVFVTLGAWMLFRERVSQAFAAGLALAVGGGALLAGAGPDFRGGSLAGDLCGVVTAVFFASYLLTVARLRRRLSALRIMTVTCIVTAAVLLALAIVAGEPLVAVTLHGWLMLAGLALVSQAGGQGLIAVAVAYLPANLSAVALMLEAVTAAALGWVLLGEDITGRQGLGGLLVLGGIWAATKASAR